MGDLNRFLARLERAKTTIERSGLSEGMVLHHDEADGLTAAALARLALQRLGVKAQLICLDKLYPEVVGETEAGPRRVVAYVDLGSGHMDWLSKLNKTQNLVLVLDHHDTSESSDPLVYNLNPELDGFSGERDASSATVAYLFGKIVDPRISGYAHLAVVGSMEVPGEVQGLNAIVARDAEEQGLAQRSGRGDFKIRAQGMSLARSRASTVLNVLGSVGYYRNGPQLGVRACTEGFDDQTLKTAQKMEEERKEANQRMLAAIRTKGLAQMKMVQWFHAQDNYAGMGGKVIGSFCSYLRYQRGVNPTKYLIGMMNVPPEIPGWGSLPSPLVKVSARAPQVLVGLIEKGERPPLSKILPESCSKTGGFGDGHSVAASGVFPVGGEERFLKEIDRLAEA